MAEVGGAVPGGTAPTADAAGVNQLEKRVASVMSSSPPLPVAHVGRVVSVAGGCSPCGFVGPCGALCAMVKTQVLTLAFLRHPTGVAQK